MITNIVVEVEARTETGKNANRRLRVAGRVPGILYGMSRPPFSVTVNPKRIEEILKLESGRNTIFQLALGGSEQNRAAMIRELQRDPIRQRVVHVDFVRVDLNKPVKVAVPIRLIGIPVGVKTDGGVLEFVTRQVEVECLPADIPEHFDLDVSELHLNQHSSVGDLPANDKVKVLTDSDAIVVVVAMVKEEAAPVVEAAPGVAAAEPEVVKKGKEGPEGEGGAKEVAVEPPVKIVLGLGNPGAKYAATRHNLGFRVVDLLARRAGVKLARRDAWSDAARVAEGEIEGEAVVLAEPRTYMNRSGRAALDLVRRFDLAPSDLVVVHDDADLALGRIRIRPDGSAGGHNGIRSVMTALGSGAFPRVKLGVHGDARERMDLAEYVLEEFDPGEREIAAALVILGADAVESVVRLGSESAMNRFNPLRANP